MHPNCRCSTAAYMSRTEETIKAQESIAEENGSDIINSPEETEDTDVHVIGKINRDIYKCITDDIVTDDVIITDERIVHIKERHSADYEEVLGFIPQVLEDPDYIMQDERPFTGLVIKSIVEDREHIQIVLRIQTSSDEIGFKNSVISCWKISDKRLHNYLRNKQIIYKKE